MPSIASRLRLLVATKSTVLLAGLVCAACHAPGSPDTSTPADSAAQADGRKPLTLEALGGSTRVDFSGRPRQGQRWLDGAQFLEARDDQWFRVDARTGAAVRLWGDHKLLESLRSVGGLDDAGRAKLAKPAPERMDAARARQWFAHLDDLWVASLDGAPAVRISETPGVPEQEIDFSPDGAHLAFVSKNDLWVGDALRGGARRVTADGGPDVLNGVLDWIYQEELYGRGNFRGWWWSPDSRAIAYLRLDQARVPRWTLVDDAAEPHIVETNPYPRAGDPNPVASLRTHRLDQPEAVGIVDLSAWKDAEPLVVDVSWSPGNRLVWQVQDREQRWLELWSSAKDGGDSRRLLRESGAAWVERVDDSIRWLSDGTFLWSSERDGWRHLYHYREDELLRQVTLHGVDQMRREAWVSGTFKSHVGSDLVIVPLDGGEPRLVTSGRATHSVAPSKDWSLYVDSWSDIATPTKVALRDRDGALVRMIDDNPVKALGEWKWSPPRLVQLENRGGFVMEGSLLLPPGFDPARKHPVLMMVYGGPHAPTVRNAWGGARMMFQQLLAQQGVIVFAVDNQSASGKGHVATRVCYQQFGKRELADFEDALDWLVAQGGVDESRVGISGWSFGGFMASYALTHSKRFALGIAGGSVTDWRDYDSIYTERYMRTPSANPQGYASTSVVGAAPALSGRLVLVHGAIDDNVHPANTMKLALALQRAGKQFELMLYPRQRHGVVEPALAAHWQRLQLELVRRHLLAD
jgi:dipeptidyl-peptidase-4